jgi:aspartyl-tRNA(Asn)/glutamyl-tRNA(Gln) amidotransferase subunit A
MRSGVLTMSEAARLVKSGDMAPGDVQEPPAGNDPFGAFCWRAPASDPGPGPLAPFPAALKANIARTGWPTDCGSRILAGYRSPFSATAVSRLEQAGARFIGTAAMDEFGMGSSCEFAATGPVQNPWRPAHTPGGSSGGSAAAVAAGLAWYALGSDTGGSVRFPAHCCGLVGFKPTWGRVSRFGLVPFASSLDTIGVLARSVEDAAWVMQLMAGRDPRDATSLKDPVPDLRRAVKDRGAGPIGVPRRLLEREHEPTLWADFQTSLEALAGAGHSLVDVELPGADQAVAVYQILASAEASSNLARYDGSLYGARQGGDSFQQMVVRTRSDGFGPEVKRRIMWGTHVLSAGYRDRLYLRALAARRQLQAAFAAIFRRVTALALPTAPLAAFPLGAFDQDPVAMHEVDCYTVPASLAGLPAISLPTGLDSRGLPLSLQLVGPPLGEASLVALAREQERVRGFNQLQEVPWRRN